MKPVAPVLPPSNAGDEHQPTLQSEIRRLCDSAVSQDERVTIPSPPTEEDLRLSTPVPPREIEEERSDTTPAPPPSSARKRTGDEGDAVPSTIPGPPRLPRIANG